jgi:hypothetical protein
LSGILDVPEWLTGPLLDLVKGGPLLTGIHFEGGIPTLVGLKGADGRKKLLTSPLAAAIRRRYPEYASERINALLHCSSDDWDRLSLSWEAIGLTVVVNRLLQPHLAGEAGLLRAVSSFKVWFFNHALKGGNVQRGRSVLPNLSRAIKDLKVLSAWAGWWASGGLSEKPDLRPEVPGFNPDLQVMELAWFGGHLAPLRAAFQPSQEIVHALVQVRVFGRALPPAFGSVLVQDGLDCIKVLGETFDPERPLLELFEASACKIGSQYPHPPWASHISVTKSATLDVPPERGGRALDVTNALSDWISQLDVLPEGQFYDCFGNIILDSIDDIHLPGTDPFLYEERHNFPLGVISMVYPYIGDPIDHLFETEEGTPPWLGPKTGYLVLALASSECLEHGSFEPAPDLIFDGVPVWRERTLVRFVPDLERPFRCRFKVLGEPGFKSRPLTINHWALVVILQNMRFLMEPPFHVDGRVRIGFESQNILWDLIKFLNKALPNFSGEVIFNNSDFKASTDYIPLGLIRAMWRGFLKGINLNRKHPFWVFSELIWTPRYVETELLESGGFHQKRGSFMGEPMSFLTLSLYNLCLTEIAGNFSKHGRSLRHLPDITEFFSEPRDPTPVGIVGDDNLSVGDKAFLDNFHSVGEASGMKFSKGKDLASSFLMILCEDHAYWDGKTIQFLDVIKLRLLTRMTRVHSDNRSAILGKASMLSTQISWDPSPTAVIAAKACYLFSFLKELDNKTFLPWLPLELPPNLGGISLPRDSTLSVLDRYPLFGSLLVWLIDQPLDTFVYWYLRLSRINQRLPKGVTPILDPETLSQVFCGYSEGNLEDYQGGSPRKFYGRSTVLEILQSFGINIPRSPYSGLPINDLIVAHAESIGLVQLSTIAESESRIKSFLKLFTEPDTEPVKLSYARYQRNFNKLLKDINVFVSGKPEIASLSPSSDPRFGSFQKIGRQFAIRFHAYIPKIDVERYLGKEMPTLVVKYPN